MSTVAENIASILNALVTKIGALKSRGQEKYGYDRQTKPDMVKRSRFLSRAIMLWLLIAFPIAPVALAQPDSPDAKSPVIDNPLNVEAQNKDAQGVDSDAYVRSWREAQSPDLYEDTEFGELIYNQASTPTKLEILRLLSKDTPSLKVFMTAVSMGLDVESVLQASVTYQPEKSRELAASAVNLLPLLNDSRSNLYSAYELDDLNRGDGNQPYAVQEVLDRFFEDRQILRPYPDWYEGQFHFLASAAELKKLSTQNNGHWYQSRSTIKPKERPVFVSLYEDSKKVLVDSLERIDQALAADPNATLPVVFIFNRLNEVAVDELDYPSTIAGVQKAYADKSLMLTPTPQWQIGEYHLYVPISEFYDTFAIPSEEDYEPEAWQALLTAAQNHIVTNRSFLVVILAGGDASQSETAASVQSAPVTLNKQYVAWADPRADAAFPYAKPKSGSSLTFKSIVSKGVILNRPDLIAALNAIGVESVPVSFYYLDKSRQRPFLKTPRALIQAAIGAGAPAGSFGGDGGFSTPVCASPPCIVPQ